MDERNKTQIIVNKTPDQQNTGGATTTYRLVSLNDGENQQNVLQSNSVKIVNQREGRVENPNNVTYLVMASNNSNSTGGGPSTRQNTPQSPHGGAKVLINNSGEPISTSSGAPGPRNTGRKSKLETSRSTRGSTGGPVDDENETSGPRNPRDDARRRQHNEVERRRRDKINTWIAKLAKIIPDCNDEHSKSSQSKGGILASCYDHILNLQRDNEELVKKINATPQIPVGASADEAYAIRLQAMEKEIVRLNNELKQAYDDRDDIIEQLKNQGITLATRPDDTGDMTSHQQQMNQQEELHRIEQENRMREQQAEQQEDYNTADDAGQTVRITSQSNGVVVIGSGDYE